MMQVETIYRAKKIDSDEWVKGFLCNDHVSTISIQVGVKVYRIDKSTLSIHFTNSGMEDSEGTQIFASLSSDGSGGDEVGRIADGDRYKALLHMLIPTFEDYYGERRAILVWSKYFKVTGIHTVKDNT